MSRNPVYLDSTTNVCALATVSGDVTAVANTARRNVVARLGSGAVTLSGSYTGQADTRIDVELTDTGGTPAPSLPVYIGVGNGTLDSLDASGATLQETISIRLASLGTPTQTATGTLLGVKVSAAFAGGEGNALKLTVNSGGIVATATNYSTLEELAEGAKDLVGSQWDFGGYALLTDGTLHPLTPRIRFGSDPEIYRPYKILDGSDWLYSFAPHPVRAVPAGTAVLAITGSYTATLSVTAPGWAATSPYAANNLITPGNGHAYLAESDGVSGAAMPTFPTDGSSVTDGTLSWRHLGSATETYPGIKTPFDLLNALETTSRLLSVTGVVADDKTPGGLAGRELSLRTDAYSLPVTFTGSRYLTGLNLITIAPTAPTELLEIRCLSNDTVGAEQWAVKGSISGSLSNAITGALYSSAVAGFVIPVQLPEQTTQLGDIGFGPVDYANRSDTEQTPNICFKALRLGRNAERGSITWTYTKKPKLEDCNCETQPYEGSPSAECLGTEQNPEESGGAMDPELQSRRLALAQWAEAHIKSNRDILLYADNYAEIVAVESDISLVQDTRQIFDDAIKVCYSSALSRTAWDAQLVELTAEYLPLVNRAAGGVQEQPRAAYVWRANAQLIPGIVPTWTGALTGIEIVPTVPNGHRYRFVSYGTTSISGAVEPTWPTTPGAQIVDGGLTWECLAAYWQPSTAYAALALLEAPNGITYRTTAGGTSGATEPVWSAYASVTDNTITWDIYQPTTTGYDLLDSATRQPPLYTIEDVGGVFYVYKSVNGVTTLDYGAPSQAVAEAHIARQQAHENTRPTSAKTRDKYLEGWREAMRSTLLAGGFDPKSDASPTDSECWQEIDADYWWVASDGHLPAFTNVYYHSARKRTNAQTGEEYIDGTQEFGFAIVVAETCIPLLKAGDAVTLVIGGVTGGATTYQVGDLIRLPIVSGQPFTLSGGQTGDDTLTFAVQGSRAGPLPNYVLDLDLPPPTYASAGLAFEINPGAIPFALGDGWSFSVEFGQYRTRQDLGSWSAWADIPASVVALGDGLLLSFQRGNAPSFVLGDSYSFAVAQPYAPGHVRDSTDTRWRVPLASASVTLTLGGASDIAYLALWHNELPSGATLTVEGSTDGFATTDWTQTLTILPRNPLCQHTFATAKVGTTHVRLTVTNGIGGYVTWLYAGLGFVPGGHATSKTLTAQYDAPTGSLGLARYRRKGAGLRVGYVWLDDAALAALTAWVEIITENNRERFVVIPRPGYARLVSLAADQLEVEDFYQLDNLDKLSANVTLNLEPVLCA